MDSSRDIFSDEEEEALPHTDSKSPAPSRVGTPSDALSQDEDEEPSAPTPKKRSTTRQTTVRRPTSNKAKPILCAGRVKDPSSFVTMDKPEATVAAYCGFNNFGAVRRFYTSEFVLPFYIRATRFRGYKEKCTLSLLEDAPYEKYCAFEEEPSEVYPVQGVDEATKKINSNYGIGLRAWQLLRKSLGTVCYPRIGDAKTKCT